MKKIGLIAGGGALPLEFIRSVKKNGERVVVFAIKNMALAELEKEADKLYWMSVGEYVKFGFLLVLNGLHEIALLGKIDKSVIYTDKTYDSPARKALDKLADKKDYSILEEITRHLGKINVKVISPTAYLSHLLPAKGILSGKLPDESVEADISFGYEVAKKITAMDIGQTIIVKSKTVVAVEAMEGTDDAITRGARIAGKGCVMVKVARPNQDMRWDVPVVGPETVQKLSENNFSALAIESGKMFVVDRDKMKELADLRGLVIKVI